MKKLMVLAIAGFFATSAMAGDMKWSGSAAWRFQSWNYNDGLGSTKGGTNADAGADISTQRLKRHQMRANFGGTGGWENVEYGFDVRTAAAGAAGTTATVSDYATVQDGADRGLALSQAWFRYMNEFSGTKINLTVGRAKPVFMFDGVSENLFSTYLRLDGFGWNFNYGMFGLNASQYVLGARSASTTQSASSKGSYNDATEKTPTTTSGWSMLNGFQGYGKWKFADEIETTFALAYYAYTGTQGYLNTSGGGYNSSTLNSTANAAITTAAAATPYTVKMDNARIWQVYNTWTLPMKLSFTGEIAWNKKTLLNGNNLSSWNSAGTATDTFASRTAWAASLGYGPASLTKAHQFNAYATYGVKGIASVVKAHTTATILPDNKYYQIKGAYNLADNFSLAAKVLWMTEKESLSAATGASYTTAEKQKQRLIEVVAGVAF